MRAIFLVICFACPGGSCSEQAEKRPENSVAKALAEARPSKRARKSLSTILASDHASAFRPCRGSSVFRRSADAVRSASQMSMQTKKFDLREMAGIIEPLGFWDPLGLSVNQPEWRLRAYRETELMYGRVAMMAVVVMLLGGHSHLLFGGGLDSLKSRPILGFHLEALASLQAFGSIWKHRSSELWSVDAEREPGDFGFDPLNLRPECQDELKKMQTKELINSRLAMLGAFSMIWQEIGTGQKFF